MLALPVLAHGVEDARAKEAIDHSEGRTSATIAAVRLGQEFPGALGVRDESLGLIEHPHDCLKIGNDQKARGREVSVVRAARKRNENRDP